VKFQVGVSTGLNLVGMPMDPGPANLSSMAVGVPWSRAWTYDGCAGGFGWKSASPGSEPNLDLHGGKGFWFNATSAGDLTLVGIWVPPVRIPLCKGWNLVAAAGFTSGLTVGALRAATGATIVAALDPTDLYHTRVLVDAATLEPGRGYWVYSAVNATWTVPGP
jgi:hypothetical protein